MAEDEIQKNGLSAGQIQKTESDPRKDGVKSGGRDPKTGTFLPGSGGRPPGIPNKVTRDVRDLLDRAVEEWERENKLNVMNVLVENAMREVMGKAQKTPRFDCMMEYWKGKPAQTVTLEGSFDVRGILSAALDPRALSEAEEENRRLVEGAAPLALTGEFHAEQIVDAVEVEPVAESAPLPESEEPK